MLERFFGGTRILSRFSLLSPPFLLPLVLGLLITSYPVDAAAGTGDTFVLDTVDVEGEIEYGPNIGVDPFSAPTMHVRARNRGAHPQEFEAILRGALEVRERMILPPGEEREMTLALPAQADYDFEIEMRAPRSGQKWSTVRYLKLEPYAFGRLGNINFALNAQEPWTDVGNLESAFRDNPSHLAGIRSIVVDIHSIPSEWALGEKVADWILQGGTLLVAVDEEEGQGVRHLFQDPAFASEMRFVNDEASQQLMGMGAIYYVPQARFAAMGVNVEGLGECQTCGWAQATERARSSSFQLHLLGVTGGASMGLLILLLVFTFLVGPLGWRWLVQKRGRPFLYLATVAGLSTVFSGAIITLDKVIHGIDTKGSLSSARVLDQRHDREITVEEALVWAPSSFTDPVVAPRQAALLVRTDDSGTRRNQGSGIVRGHEQILEDVLSVRTPTLVASRYVGRLRHRLDVASTGQGLVVENHLGHGLTQLQLWFDGRHYSARQLSPGERIVLQPSGSTGAIPTHMQGHVISAMQPLLERLQAGELGSNRFFAVADESVNDPPLMGEDFRDLGRGQHWVGGVL